MKIILRNLFDDLIVTRVSVRTKLEQIFSSQNDLIFDFENISFISRSSADEFVNLQRESMHAVQIINASQDVHKMFNSVLNAKQQGIKKSTKHTTAVVYV